MRGRLGGCLQGGAWGGWSLRHPGQHVGAAPGVEGHLHLHLGDVSLSLEQKPGGLQPLVNLQPVGSSPSHEGLEILQHLPGEAVPHPQAVWSPVDAAEGGLGRHHGQEGVPGEDVRGRHSGLVVAIVDIADRGDPGQGGVVHHRH